MNNSLRVGRQVGPLVRNLTSQNIAGSDMMTHIQTNFFFAPESGENIKSCDQSPSGLYLTLNTIYQ